MTLFDNLKNKLFKEETSGKGKESQPAGKSKDLQDRIKGLFAKKPDEVEQAVEELDMSREAKRLHVTNVLSKRNLLTRPNP